MKISAVFLLTACTCALLTTGVMAASGHSSSSEDSDALDEVSLMASLLGTMTDPLPQSLVLIDDTADDQDSFTRRRRFFNGAHSRYPTSGRRFRSRPRVFVPRTRPGNRGSSRNNVSPY